MSGLQSRAQVSSFRQQRQAKCVARRRKRSLSIERLEDRRVMAQLIGWGFEEASGNVLDTAIANGTQNGVLTNGALRVSGGIIGSQAVSLDGVDDKVVFTGNISQTESLSGLTLSAWINPNALRGNS